VFISQKRHRLSPVPVTSMTTAVFLKPCLAVHRWPVKNLQVCHGHFKKKFRGNNCICFLIREAVICQQRKMVHHMLSPSHNLPRQLISKWTLAWWPLFQAIASSQPNAGVTCDDLCHLYDY
jgi:hypothetical protein